MVEQYCHTLIARRKNATPSARQVQEFIEALVRMQAVPSPQKCVLMTPSGFREVQSPFTGEMISMPTKKSQRLETTNIEAALLPLADYELEVSGEGRPGLPCLPLPDDAPNRYWMDVTVVVSSVLRSTSDTYNGFNPPLIETLPFGTPCDGSRTTGYFSNLHKGTVIEVPDGGAAHFWIEFQLGKFLFPPFVDDLNILDPTIVTSAEDIFGIEFVQGCHWLA